MVGVLPAGEADQVAHLRRDGLPGQLPQEVPDLVGPGAGEHRVAPVQMSRPGPAAQSSIGASSKAPHRSVARPEILAVEARTVTVTVRRPPAHSSKNPNSQTLIPVSSPVVRTCR